MKTIICDIDGTLSDCSHRLHFLENKDWESFFAAAPQDTLNQWCFGLLENLQGQYHIVFVTGRPERTRSQTEQWMIDHEVPYYHIYMRPDFLPNGKPDHRQDFEVKRELYERYLKDKDIAFVIDDRNQVVDEWRRLGLVCLQCADGNY